MLDSNVTIKTERDKKKKMAPAGKTKIENALISLLEKKDFNAITTAEIARNAGVTEPLIYKYFKNKQDLLHQVLKEYLEQFYDQIILVDLKGIKGALNKLRKIIWSHIYVYANNRVFARILLVDVRSNKDYYESEIHGIVKKYSQIILEVIEEGKENGEIRADIPSITARQGILGCIEHVCLTRIIFDRDIDPDELSENLCKFIFSGIEVNSNST